MQGPVAAFKLRLCIQLCIQNMVFLVKVVASAELKALEEWPSFKHQNLLEGR